MQEKIKSFKLETGDVLLVPTQKQDDLVRLLKSFGLNDNIITMSKIQQENKYIHTQLYLGNSWVMEQTDQGVRIWKQPTSVFTNYDVYRFRRKNDYEKFDVLLVQSQLKYFNKPYDFQSLILNTISEVVSFGNDYVRNVLKEWLGEKYNNPNFVICSELVQRIYKEQIGYDISSNLEFVTPDDFQRSLDFEKVW